MCVPRPQWVKLYHIHYANIAIPGFTIGLLWWFHCHIRNHYRNHHIIIVSRLTLSPSLLSFYAITLIIAITLILIYIYDIYIYIFTSLLIHSFKMISLPSQTIRCYTKQYKGIKIFRTVNTLFLPNWNIAQTQIVRSIFSLPSVLW